MEEKEIKEAFDELMMLISDSFTEITKSELQKQLKETNNSIISKHKLIQEEFINVNNNIESIKNDIEISLSTTKNNLLIKIEDLEVQGLKHNRLLKLLIFFILILLSVLFYLLFPILN